LQTILGPLVLFEGRLYPTSAKYLLQLEGLGNTLHSRVRPSDDMTYRNRLEVAQLRALVDYARGMLQQDSPVPAAAALAPAW
jgi:4-hydroxy-tetrahydrodipicolinate synthase